MPDSIFTHPALVSIPAAVAVIVISGMFLKHLSTWGRSRDQEREASLTVIQKMGSDFTQSLKELNEARVAEQREMVVCMQTIVDKCGGKDGRK